MTATVSIAAALSDIGERARDVLTRALFDRHAFTFCGDLDRYPGHVRELTLFSADWSVVRALTEMLSDVTAVEWDGEPRDGGTPYRTYRGVLPCGLLVAVATDRRDVPDMTVQAEWVRVLLDPDPLTAIGGAL